ncbi:O-antigen ligase family protein [Halorientalis pallida]|uniref:O-antigen ligase family protein n=1 Tax=Halorientalis pallida TaxID=2479928 RepID=UPI003C6F7DE9
MTRTTHWFLLLCIVGLALLPRSALLPNSIAYVLTALPLLAVGYLLLRQRKLEITVHRPTAILLMSIYAVFVFHALSGGLFGTPSLNELVRAITFTLVTSVYLFFVPKIFAVEDFIWMVARVSAVVALIGIPTAVVGTYSLFGITVTPHVYDLNLPLFVIDPATIDPITSIMDNPNSMGFVVSLGFACGLAEIERDWRDWVAWGVLGINFLGAYLTGSRAAAGALGITVSVYLSYKVLGRWMTGLYVGTLLASLVYVLAVALGFLPGPEPIATLNLRDRELIWLGIWRAIETSPLFGVGLGNHMAFIAPYAPPDGVAATHNSYARMLLTTGFVGAVAYVLLTLSAIRLSFRATGPAKISLIAGTTIIAFHQIWVGFSIFGLATQSVLSAILFGYVITGSDAEFAPPSRSESGGESRAGADLDTADTAPQD